MTGGWLSRFRYKSRPISGSLFIVARGVPLTVSVLSLQSSCSALAVISANKGLNSQGGRPGPHHPWAWKISAGNHWKITENPGLFQPAAGAAILNSGVPRALNLISGSKNEIMRMISMFQKISKSGAMAVHAQSLTFYAPPSPPRLKRYPRISDAGG